MRRQSITSACSRGFSFFATSPFTPFVPFVPLVPFCCRTTGLRASASSESSCAQTVLGMYETSLR